MSVDRRREIERVFHSALGLEPDRRARFLVEACRGDEALRRELESLLVHAEEAEGFIDEPALESVARELAGDQIERMIGRQVGPYVVISLLGAGGMAEVYLAEDKKLGRRAALKFLPGHLTGDQERVRRFQQEARAASALSHPSIATIYDIGEADGVSYIAMEYVEGVTLATRIPDGPLELIQIVDIGIQVADALEDAHANGIIHRDIKSNNMMITPRGQVKVLDFGLAKVTRREGVGRDIPTQATTEPGLVMGTVAYMSPEQALGRVLDRRTDLFSLGVVLYEMTTGRLPFSAASAGETMDRIVHAQPEAIARFNYSAPDRLEHIIRKCLEKEPDRRYQSARDLSIDLKNLKRDLESGTAVVGMGTRVLPSDQALFRFLRKRPSHAIVALLVILAGMALALAYFQRAPVKVRAVRSFILPPENTSFAPTLLGPFTAVSPDGRRLAFLATMAEGKHALWVRAMDALSAQALAGTEDAQFPFWSPDSRFIGFFANQKLRKIDVSGGPPVTLCDAPSNRGGTWNPDGVIIFGALAGGLSQVSATGGEVSAVTKLDQAGREATHRWPYFLPDGQHFLYLGMSTAAGESELGAIYVASLESKQSKLLLQASSNVAYADGYLLFLREATLMAQRFDSDRLEVAGDAFPVAEQIQYASWTGRGAFSVSENGVLAYQTRAGRTDSQLTWFDRTGKRLGVLGDPAFCDNHRLSPDGKSVMLTILDPQTRTRDIWIYDVASGLRTRFTSDPAEERNSTWSSDGSRIVYSSNRRGYFDLYQKASSGAGEEDMLLE
ncbi:MAG: serine/threonine-protein kinase, partial [Acidobacteria bacterium]|nr:serine/threonine-protein kinase [Acidobacteriota bacterium]